MLPANTENMCWEIRTEELEKDAREPKKGLWADPQPVPPWEVKKTEVRGHRWIYGRI
jgi:endonuclease YncB( thermonuclease family)